MLSKLIIAVVYAVVAYLLCILVGGLFTSLNITIAVVLGGFLKEFAGLISVLVFLYYAFLGTTL